MKVKTTFTVEIISELNQCVTRTLEFSETNLLDEKDNIEGCIKDALGFPDGIEIICTDVKRVVCA